LVQQPSLGRFAQPRRDPAPRGIEKAGHGAQVRAERSELSYYVGLRPPRDSFPIYPVARLLLPPRLTTVDDGLVEWLKTFESIGKTLGRIPQMLEKPP